MRICAAALGCQGLLVTLILRIAAPGASSKAEQCHAGKGTGPQPQKHAEPGRTNLVACIVVVGLRLMSGIEARCGKRGIMANILDMPNQVSLLVVAQC